MRAQARAFLPLPLPPLSADIFDAGVQAGRMRQAADGFGGAHGHGHWGRAGAILDENREAAGGLKHRQRHV